MENTTTVAFQTVMFSRSCQCQHEFLGPWKEHGFVSKMLAARKWQKQEREESLLRNLTPGQSLHNSALSLVKMDGQWSDHSGALCTASVAGAIEIWGKKDKINRIKKALAVTEEDKRVPLRHISWAYLLPFELFLWWEVHWHVGQNRRALILYFCGLT